MITRTKKYAALTGVLHAIQMSIYSSHVESIVEHISKSGWVWSRENNTRKVNGWLNEEGNPEHTLECIVKKLATMDDKSKVTRAVEVIQKTLYDRKDKLRNYVVFDMLNAEDWDIVPEVAEEWELV